LEKVESGCVLCFNTIYLYVLFKIGKIIRYDFTADFKELSSSARIKSELFVASEKMNPMPNFGKTST
jgi:hypothetical protein